MILLKISGLARSVYYYTLSKNDKDDKNIDVVNDMYEDNVLEDDDIEELDLSKEKDDFEK